MTRFGTESEYGTFVVQFSGISKRELERSLKKRKRPGNGGVAQLGEHLPCKQGVMGSNPIISTSFKTKALMPWAWDNMMTRTNTE